MEDVLPFVGIPISIIVFMVVFFVVIPNLGDWKKLTRHYGSTQSPKTVMGEKIHFNHIKVGGLNMKNMVKGYISNKGLFLYQYLDILKRAPNILIPWEEFHSAQERKFLFLRSYRIYVGHPVISYLEVSARIYERLADRLPKA